MNTPFTVKRHAQYRGPTTSDSQNERIEENYQDLVWLTNISEMSQVELQELYRRMLQEHTAMRYVINDLEQRIITLEGSATRLHFFSASQVDNDRFNNNPTFTIGTEQRLTVDAQHGLVTLPRVASSSLSKLFFVNTDGEGVLPPSLEMRVVGTANTADTASALIDESPSESAVYKKPGVIWERNVVVDAVSIHGAEMTVYIKVPTDLYTTERSNAIAINPYPSFGATIREIAYTLNAHPIMEDADGYTPLNSGGNYTGEPEAIGWVAPGGWAGTSRGLDAIEKSGPKLFYFPPMPVTGLRIKLHQSHVNQEDAKYIYSYGISHLDLRYDKFLSTGRAMIRFDAPSGRTISAVNNVEPQIFNVARNYISSGVDSVFNYRVIWETSYNSGEYTLEPVANSQRVWIEVSLNDYNGQVPSLSGLSIEYT